MSKLHQWQKVKIYKDPLEKTQFEGTATLLRRVNIGEVRTPIPAECEVWEVRFDADDEARVTRVIAIDDKNAFTMSMLSAMARSPEGKSLLDFMVAAGLSADWEDPQGHDVSCDVSGRFLSNKVGPNVLDGSRPNNELLVHLDIDGPSTHTTTVNLNTILALASAYVRQQYGIAEEAVRRNTKGSVESPSGKRPSE